MVIYGPRIPVTGECSRRSEEFRAIGTRSARRQLGTLENIEPQHATQNIPARNLKLAVLLEPQPSPRSITQKSWIACKLRNVSTFAVSSA